MNRIQKHLPIVANVSSITVVACIAVLLLSLTGCSSPAPGTFASPEEAVQALHDSIGSGDHSWIEEMFGPGSLDLFSSGDEVDDRQSGQRVKEMIARKVEIDEIDADTVVALLGEEAWPFPIPLVQHDSRWHFDTEAGRDELLNRRIGLNELWTLATLHEYVDAQFEYAAIGRDGNPPAFAQRVRSSEGLQDGLFWDTIEGEPLSPLGDLLAAAETDDPAGVAQRPDIGTALAGHDPRCGHVVAREVGIAVLRGVDPGVDVLGVDQERPLLPDRLQRQLIRMVGREVPGVDILVRHVRLRTPGEAHHAVVGPHTLQPQPKVKVVVVISKENGSFCLPRVSFTGPKGMSTLKS